MKTQDKVKVIVERREESRRIVRDWVLGTIISEPRYHRHGYMYHWCIVGDKDE